MRRRNVRTLSLIVVTFTYLLIGAAVFDALEGPYNEDSFEALNQVRQKFVSKYNMSEDDYRIFELIVIERKPHMNGPQWKFAGAFYYALVVLALIGYGHSTPNTKLGKAATMVYAMVGIPMAMVMFQSMGERMNKCFSLVIRRLRTWLGCSRVDANEFDLIVASGFTSSVVIACGASMYHYQEGWSLFDSLYYSFITLSTIGFGDFVALQNDKALLYRPGYVVCSFVFLLLGLASFASSVNLLVLRFMIISLEEEEEEQEAELLDATFGGAASSLDIEVVVASAGARFRQEQQQQEEKAGGGHHHHRKDLGSPQRHPGGGWRSSSQRVSAREPEVASVCSCTCYGSSQQPQVQLQGLGLSVGRTRGRQAGSQRAGGGHGLFGRIVRCLGGRDCNDRGSEDGNFYDEETQSISNYAKFAIKRASL